MHTRQLQQYTQDNYSNTHKTTNNNTHKTTNNNTHKTTNNNTHKTTNNNTHKTTNNNTTCTKDRIIDPQFNYRTSDSVWSN